MYPSFTKNTNTIYTSKTFLHHYYFSFCVKTKLYWVPQQTLPQNWPLIIDSGGKPVLPSGRSNEQKLNSISIPLPD